MWPFSYLRPTQPQEMSQQEAIATGVVPPLDYQPPARAPLSATIRTLRVGAGVATGYAARMLFQPGYALPLGTTDEGAARIKAYACELLDSLGVDLQVVHADRVPATGGVVLMWKQESHLDHLALPAALPRPCYTLFNTSVRDTPVYGRYLQRGGHFWVDKSDETQWRASVARAAHQVRQGACALVSPEGTRSWDGEILQMKRGAFILAEESQCPIVGVTLVGAHERMPRGAFAVRPGPLRIVFSEPIFTDGALRGDALKDAVATALVELKRKHAFGTSPN